MPLVSVSVFSFFKARGKVGVGGGGKGKWELDGKYVQISPAGLHLHACITVLFAYCEWPVRVIFWLWFLQHSIKNPSFRSTRNQRNKNSYEEESLMLVFLFSTHYIWDKKQTLSVPYKWHLINLIHYLEAIDYFNTIAATLHPKNLFYNIQRKPPRQRFLSVQKHCTGNLRTRSSSYNI